MKSSTMGGMAICFLGFLLLLVLAYATAPGKQHDGQYLVCRDKAGSCFAVLNGRHANFAAGDTVAVARNSGGLYLPASPTGQFAQMIVVR